MLQNVECINLSLSVFLQCLQKVFMMDYFSFCSVKLKLWKCDFFLVIHSNVVISLFLWKKDWLKPSTYLYLWFFLGCWQHERDLTSCYEITQLCSNFVLPIPVSGGELKVKVKSIPVQHHLLENLSVALLAPLSPIQHKKLHIHKGLQAPSYVWQRKCMDCSSLFRRFRDIVIQKISMFVQRHKLFM